MQFRRFFGCFVLYILMVSNELVFSQTIQTLPQNEPGATRPGNACDSSKIGVSHGTLVCRRVGASSKSFWLAKRPFSQQVGGVQTTPNSTRIHLGGERLRRGRLTFLLRHTDTDWTESTRERDNQQLLLADRTLADDCSAQRNLTDTGREKALEIGHHFQRLRLPVTQVLTSVFCRTRETAGLIDVGLPHYEYGLFDLHILGQTQEGLQAKAFLREMLRRPPEMGIKVLVTHAHNIHDATGIRTEEGETVVVAHGVNGPFVIARVLQDSWRYLE